jgi:hypothetical protein
MKANVNKLAMTLLVVAATALAACGSLNPLSKAQTLEQKAYALYGQFTIVEEQAASLVQEASVPASAKKAIAQADAVAKPVADKLLAATLAVDRARDDLAAGRTTEEKLLIATANLQRWYDEVLPLIRDLAAAVKGAKP